MFSIEYRLEKKGDKPYSLEYSNDATADLDSNIFLVEGPNEQGKSVLLQMIGLGLFGRRVADQECDLQIDWNLRERIAYLISKDTERCEIGYTIVSKDEQIKLQAEVDGSTNHIWINDNLKDFDHVSEKFKLIYDVPAAPVEKLKPSLHLLQSRLITYASNVNSYSNAIETALEQLKDFRDKEQRLKTVETNIETTINTLKKQQEDKVTKEAEREELRKASVVYAYEALNKRYDELYDTILKLEIRKEKFKKKVKVQESGGSSKALREFLSARSEAESAIASSQDLAEFKGTNQQTRIQQILVDVKNVSAPQDVNLKTLENWRIFFKELLQDLNEHPLSKVEPKEKKEIEFLKSLLDVLETFSSSVYDLQVPATNGKNIEQFRQDVALVVKEKEIQIRDKLNLEAAKAAIQSIVSALLNLEEKIPETPESSELQIEYDSVCQRYERAMAEAENTTKEISKIEPQFEAVPLEERGRYYASGIGAKDRLKTNDAFIAKLSDQIDDLESRLDSYRKQQKALEKTAAPPKIDETKLRERAKILFTLRAKIDRWIGYVSTLIKDITAPTLKNKDESRHFCDALGFYFADSLEDVWARERKWKVTHVDFLEGQYHVEGRTAPLPFATIGTGSTTLTGLIASLRQPSPGQKKIVLFDEIELMDKHLRASLLKEINTKIKSGEVLIALLTQVNDDLDKLTISPVRCP